MNKKISYSKIRLFSVIILVAILSVSCGKQSSDYKKLKAQNDSLLKEKAKLESEVDDYFSSINQAPKMLFPLSRQEKNYRKMHVPESTKTSITSTNCCKPTKMSWRG